MTPNIALVERTTRLGLGMLLLASPLLELQTYPYNLLGLVPVVTALVGYCPLYGLFTSPRQARASGRTLAQRT